MSEKNIVSADELIAAVNGRVEPPIEVEWRGVKIQVAKYMSLENMLMFVQNVTESCFAEESGEYMPEVKDFATRCAIIESYTNIVLPDDIHDRYAAAYYTDLVPLITDRVEKSQYCALLTAVDKKLEHMARNNSEALNKQVEDLVDNLGAIEKSLSDVFSGVDSDTINQLAGAMTKGGFDEEKLVRAVVEQTKGSVAQFPKQG